MLNVSESWPGMPPMCRLGGGCQSDRGRGREVTESGRRKRKTFLNDANQSRGARPSLSHQAAVIQMCREPGIKRVTMGHACVCVRQPLFVLLVSVCERERECTRGV